MASFLVQINTGSGLATAPYVPGTLSIALRRGSPSTCKVTLMPDPASVNHPWKMDQAFVVKSAGGGTTYFSGVIESHSAQFIGGHRVRTVAITARGIDRLLSSGRVRVNRTYELTAAGDIIKDIVSKNLGSSFTTAGVVDGPVITLIFEDVSVQEAFSRIEDTCLGFVLMIDAAGAITFGHEDDLTASSVDIDEDDGEYDPASVTVERGAARYYNRVTLIGPAAKGPPITEEFPPAQYDNTYWGGKFNAADFPSSGTNAIYDKTNDAYYNAVRAGSGIDEGDAASDFLWTPGNPIVERKATLTDPGGSGEVTIEATYNPYMPHVITLQRNYAIDARGGYPAGMFEAPLYKLDRYTSIGEMLTIGLAFLQANSRREFTRIKWQTDTVTTAGTLIVPGTTVQADIALENLSGTFRVESVTYTDALQHDEWTMTVTALQGTPATNKRALGQALTAFAMPKPETLMDYQSGDPTVYPAGWQDDIDIYISGSAVEA